MENGAADEPMADLLVLGAERLVTMTGEELAGGWVSIRDGLAEAVGVGR